MNVLILGRSRDFTENCIKILSDVLRRKNFLMEAKILRKGGVYIGILSFDVSSAFLSFDQKFDVAICYDLELAYLSQDFLKDEGVIISFKKKPATKIGMSFHFKCKVYTLPPRYTDPSVLLGGLSFLRVLPVRREDFIDALRYGDEKRISLFRFGERSIRLLSQ